MPKQMKRRERLAFHSVKGTCKSIMIFKIHIIIHTFAAFVFDYEHKIPKTLPNASFSFHVEVLTATEASPTRVTCILLQIH